MMSWPEAPHAAQDRLADAVYAELAEAHDPARIILNGDSAGGHMALALALRLARNGSPMPGKLALFAAMARSDAGRSGAIAAVEPHDLMLKIGTLRACVGHGRRRARSGQRRRSARFILRQRNWLALPPTPASTPAAARPVHRGSAHIRGPPALPPGARAQLYEYEAARRCVHGDHPHA